MNARMPPISVDFKPTFKLKALLGQPAKSNSINEIGLECTGILRPRGTQRGLQVIPRAVFLQQVLPFCDGRPICPVFPIGRSS